MKQKILIISPQLPTNPNGGARVLQDRFKVLSRDYDLFMLAKHKEIKDNENGLDYFKMVYIIKKTKPRNILLFIYRYFIASISLMYYLILVKKIKIVQIEFYDGLIYSMFLLPLKILGVKIFYTAHDIQCLYYNKNTLHFKLTKLIEYICFKFFINYIFVWGEDDKLELISWKLNTKKVKIVRPIFHPENNEVWKMNPSTSNFVFMGSINHSPNRDALNYILNEIWPYIKKYSPRSKLYLIVGQSNNRLNIDDLSVVNCGFVEDPIDIMKKCNIFLAPIISGTGIKIKIIESFGFGIPLITTKLGFRNFDSLDKNIVLVAENNEEFLTKIKKIISNQEKLEEISEYQKTYFEHYFTEKNIILYKKYYSTK